MIIPAWIRYRLTNRPDTEHEQALIRIVIVSLVYGYLALSAQFGHLDNTETGKHALILTKSYLLYAVANVCLILIWPRISVLRRVFGAAADATALSFCLILSHKVGAVLFMFYLWVTLGNGFRYGRNYLYLSAALNVIGFVGVLFFSTFWQRNILVWCGVVLGMVLIPSYVSRLLRALEEMIGKAKAASTAKSRFLANMSHEMRTPLNGVIGMADILSTENLPPAAREIARTIHASADALLALINDVLDISKIEEGHLSVKPEPFDLHVLAHNIARMIEIQIASERVRFYLDVSSRTPFQLIGDSHLLRQILINLLGNAAKFTHQGEIRLSIFPVSYHDNHVRIRFEVCDTGIGIPDKAKERLFDPFTQADDSTTRRYGGTGLGTTIAKELVTAMEGTIDFSSKEGEGTTFWFELSFEKAEPPKHAQQRMLSGLTALVLTRDDSLSHSLHEYLASWGIAMLWVSSSGELWTALKSPTADRFDFLIIDFCCISVDLSTLGQSIGAALANQDIHKIVITRDDDETPSIDHVHAGFNAVIPKPIDKQVLFNGLHATIDLRNEVPSIIDAYSRKNDLAKLNILVADDNEINRQVVETILVRGGHTVTLVSNGEQALDILGQEEFDLIILDMQMPKLSGIEALRMIRMSEPAHCERPIMILSANATEEAQAEARTAGATDYLTKPVTADVLLSRIRRMIVQTPSETLLKKTENQNDLTTEAQSEITARIDFSALEQLSTLGNGIDFVAHIYESFQTDANKSIQQMKTALEEGDWLTYNDTAHALKGNASYLGGQWLATCCREAQTIKPADLSHHGWEQLERIELGVSELVHVLEKFTLGTAARLKIKQTTGEHAN
jgi:two-component system sensor histidine kinase RpfC